jgi:phenylalanyl-tRNA synthetase alpha chain
MANILEKTNLHLDAIGVSSSDQISALFAEVRQEFNKQNSDLFNVGVSNLNQWEALRLSWLGRKNGILTHIADNWLKPVTPTLKGAVGQEFNKLRAHIEAALDSILEVPQAQDGGLAADLSLPGVTRPIGTRHLISQTYEELYRIFNSIGFSIVEGAEIETPYYNFEALNIPEHHPARDNMDTFYLGNAPGYLLRTHTSPMQVRTMEKQKPPVRIVVPGKVYRRDNPDATHSFMFHQLEGLAVDTDITFCDFKGTIEYFAKQFFGPQTRVRLRPSYFPFTEPSAEFDASCHVCGGSGCRTCKYSGWIELFGAGMVDPAVYGFVDYDPKRVSGFAFGLGVDRLAMLKYGIDDLQQFFRNDTRFLRQFP